VRGLLGAARVTEWWEHKLALIAGTAYATAFFAGTSLLDVAGALLLVLLALAPGAAYVSLLNDLTDRDADRRAGKPNRAEGRQAGPWWLGVAAAVAAGAAIALVAWRDEPLVLVLYAGAWLAFALYSVPPVRLKARGAAGALADAAGAHVFPHLFTAAVLLAEAPGAGSDGWLWDAGDAAWLAVVGVWALASGVRGALLHQLGDVEADRRIGLRTFAVAHPRLAHAVGARIAFPLALLAFAALLVLSGGLVAAVLLPLYALLEVRRTRRWGVPLVVVRRPPGPGYRIALHEYYLVLYPLAFLASSIAEHPEDAVVLAVHVVLFPTTTWRFATDVVTEARHVLGPLRGAVRR
jgi:4-hydroxybenzoate polyprenyltransferase